MSIAQNQRMKDMEAKLKELEERIKALENRPKPGRPPKNG